MIRDLLLAKSPQERAVVKSAEIAKLDHKGIFVSPDGIKVEIQSLNEIVGGVEMFARAWKNGKQLGFGKDGSVEIERFKVINPPILVPDTNGFVISEWTDRTTGELKRRLVREDPIEAIRQSLAHTIKLVGEENSQIVKGKIGNTTSTFYPVVQEDRYIAHYGSNTWSTIRDAATGTDIGGVGAGSTLIENSHYNAANYFQVTKYFIPFTTGADIPDTDNIDSGTLSLYGAAGSQNDEAISIGIVESTQANQPPLVADFDAHGSTEFATRIALSAWSTAAYNDFALNASGLAAVSKTGDTMYCVRGSLDLDNTSPGAAVKVSYCSVQSSTTAGTTQDPKLVVVHTAGSIPNKVYQFNQAVNRASTY